MKPALSAIVAAVAALSACASLSVGRRLNRSPDMRAADGTVKFRTLRGADTGIDLRVKHLVEPDQLLPPGYVYVAWVRRTPDDPAQNVGVLNLDADLAGALTTVTPLRRFTLFVTVEATRDAERPAGPRLLWASRE